MFGNDASWIQAAIAAAYSRFSAYPIDVKMMNFVRGKDYIDTGVAQIAQSPTQPVTPAPHFSGGSAAGHHAAGFQAASTHAVMSGGHPPASAAKQMPNSKQQLAQHLGELWVHAYAIARDSGAVDANVFAKIRQLRQDGILSPAEVAAWINRRNEPSGYTLLHQIAWHGNYERHKQVCSGAVRVTIFRPDFRSSRTWELTRSC